MNKIFTYTKNAKISDKILKKLEEIGYLCIEVRTLSDVKVIEDFSDFESAWLLKTALEVIEESHSSSQEFARRIISKKLGRDEVEG